MTQARNNAEEARSVLRDAIQSGVYPRGSTLPSTRELASQFGINRNTANKIYHELAGDRLIELAVNRPPVVIGDGSTDPEAALLQRIHSALRPLLHESLLIGLSPEEARSTLIHAADQFFEAYRTPSIYVAECNELEARAYAQELTIKLGSLVRPILLEQLDRARSADIIVTPYFHLNETREALGDNADRVIGLVITADSADIADIASRVTTGPLGIISVNLDAAERLRRLLSFQIDVPMVLASIDHPEQIEALRGTVECIACTVRADRGTWHRILDIPTVLVRYHADEQSIDLLRTGIQRLGQDGVLEPTVVDLTSLDE